MTISDEMVTRALGAWFGSPATDRDEAQMKIDMRAALTAALQGSVVVPEDNPAYEGCAAKLAVDFQYRADGHFREDVIAACVRTIEHAKRWRDSGHAVRAHALTRHDGDTATGGV